MSLDPFFTYEDNVLPALAHAERVHGHLTYDHCRALTILIEEVGEAAKEVLDIARHAEGSPAQHEARTLAIAELAQVTATAILMMRNLKEEL